MSRQDFSGRTVLVTGASSGIGEAFARALAQQGAGLVLVARSGDKLAHLAEELGGVTRAPVRHIAMDLSQPGAVAALYAQLDEAGMSVDLLINNAGFGKWGDFLADTPSTYQAMLDLNVGALVQLTHYALSRMQAAGGGGIINVASTAAFQPIPFQAAYAASKAFVLSFSEALYGEFRSKGIAVMALCPGLTKSGFAQTANAETTGMPEATPEFVVASALRAFARGRQYHIPGRKNYLSSLLPRLLTRRTVVAIVARMFRGRGKMA